MHKVKLANEYFIFDGEVYDVSKESATEIADKIPSLATGTFNYSDVVNDIGNHVLVKPGTEGEVVGISIRGGVTRYVIKFKDTDCKVPVLGKYLVEVK